VLYLDEDSSDGDLRLALEQRGFAVRTAIEAGTAGMPDEEQLAFASAEGFILITANVGDFHALHGRWLAAGRSHFGIVVVPQLSGDIGYKARSIADAVEAHKDGRAGWIVFVPAARLRR
jgi:hypothetical protein